MSDYISREIVLENVLDQMTKSTSILAMSERIKNLEAADVIEELQKDLERSKDFEAFWQHAAEETLKKFQVAISNKPRWIPVTERLPEYMENVLVTDGVFSGMGWRDWYDHHGTKPREDYWIAPSTNVNELNITHWMPLPEPPRRMKNEMR